MVEQVERADVEVALRIVSHHPSELLHSSKVTGLDLDIEAGVVCLPSNLKWCKPNPEAPVKMERVVGVFVSRRPKPPACHNQPLNRKWRIGIDWNGCEHTPIL